MNLLGLSLYTDANSMISLPPRHNSFTYTRLENGAFDELLFCTNVVQFGQTIKSEWDSDTILHAKFDNDLRGGNLEYRADTVSTVRVKRRERGENGSWITLKEFPIKETSDFTFTYEMFFDGDTFVCKEIPSCKDDPVILNHEVIDPLIISENTTVDETTIRNCTEVWGSSIDSDYYTENVSYADGCYTLTYDSALTNFKVKSNKRFSFVAPETNAKGCSVKMVQGENTFGPYKIYSGTDKDGNDVELDAGVMAAKKYYVIKCYKDADKNLRMQYLGQGQVHAMVILSDNPPTGDAYEQAKIDEACDVLEYISTNDPSDTTGMYHSPYSIEKIGRRNSVLSGGDFENIPNDDLGLQRAEYENWKSCRLTDVKTLEMIMIPWLDVNKKISYTPRSGKPGEKHSPMEYITKEITINLGSGTMSVNMQKFYPYYPYITKKGE